MGRVSNAKETLMTAVLELIWQGSYGATTIDQICERANVNLLQAASELTKRTEPTFPDSPSESGSPSDTGFAQAEQSSERAHSKTPSQGYTTLQFHRSAVALRKGAFGWISAHERALSALSMIGGFLFDNYAFRRIDLPNTQLVFIGYLALARSENVDP